MSVREPTHNPFTQYELAGKPKPGPKPKPEVTTMAVGEEAGSKPKPGEVTTMMVGEEAGSR